MKVGPYTIRVLAEGGGVREVRSDEEPAVTAQMRLAAEAAAEEVTEQDEIDGEMSG